MADNRPTMDEVAVEITKIMAKRSSCPKRQVGAVITKGGRIISSGYVGAPPGMPHCIDEGVGCLLDSEKKCVRTIHAEQNAVAVASKYGISTDGGTMFCTVQPCYTCAKVILAAGIKRVVYVEEYRKEVPGSLDLFESAGIAVLHWKK
ncbi:MAG TPA: cytidine/deoxycytidylate deaminase family protein [Candidatus Saccharimonadales bacterium]|nr:cytidine/deoxycytidylate deaminase family protein [Candidatus Saccharimonadales bacterium]